MCQFFAGVRLCRSMLGCWSDLGSLSECVASTLAPERGEVAEPDQFGSERLKDRASFESAHRRGEFIRHGPGLSTGVRLAGARGE